MVILIKGETLNKDHLNIYIQKDGVYVDPFAITYTIYRQTRDFWTKTTINEEPYTETIDSIPLPFGKGKYFAPWQMPKDVEIGNYRIKWRFREFADSPWVEEPEEFSIIVQSQYQAEANSVLPHTAYKGGCAEYGR